LTETSSACSQGFGDGQRRHREHDQKRLQHGTHAASVTPMPPTLEPTTGVPMASAGSPETSPPSGSTAARARRARPSPGERRGEVNGRPKPPLLHPGLHLIESDAVTDDEKPRLGRHHQDSARRVEEEVVALGPPDVCDEPDHRRAAESELSLLSLYVKRRSAA